MLPFNARWNAGIASPEEEQQGRGTDVGRQRGLLAIAIILHCVLVVVVPVLLLLSSSGLFLCEMQLLSI